MKAIRFIVYGEPMGKQRPRFSHVGNFVKTYTPKETTNYESGVKFCYKKKAEETGFIPFEPHQMIIATINAYFQIPKCHYVFHKKTNTSDLDKTGVLMKENRVRPTKKPDCDNIGKICLDALNGLAYIDDSQIVSLAVQKLYSEEPRVEIKLESIL